jgi:hypothetical protein
VKAVHKEKAEPSARSTAGRHAALTRALNDVVLDFSGFDDPKTTLQEALDHLAKRSPDKVSFLIDQRAFKAESAKGPELFIIQDGPIPPMRTTLAVILKQILANLPVQAVYRFRHGCVEITTVAAVRAELGLPEGRPLLPLVWETFHDTPLPEAFRRLADASDFNVVVDGRAADKVKEARVSAELSNVPVDTAVRLLADMNGLAPVRLDNVFYVTTPENAARLRAERHRAAAKPAAPPGPKPSGKAGK